MQVELAKVRQPLEIPQGTIRDGRPAELKSSQAAELGEWGEAVVGHLQVVAKVDGDRQGTGLGLVGLDVAIKAKERAEGALLGSIEFLIGSGRVAGSDEKDK